MECPYYEYDEEFDKHICHASQEDECPKEYVNECKYQPPEYEMYEDYYGEFGLY